MICCALHQTASEQRSRPPSSGEQKASQQAHLLCVSTEQQHHRQLTEVLLLGVARTPAQCAALTAVLTCRPIHPDDGGCRLASTMPAVQGAVKRLDGLEAIWTEPALSRLVTRQASITLEASAGHAAQQRTPVRAFLQTQQVLISDLQSVSVVQQSIVLQYTQSLPTQQGPCAETLLA